jgi:hypothetical protein
VFPSFTNQEKNCLIIGLDTGLLFDFIQIIPGIRGNLEDLYSDAFLVATTYSITAYDALFVAAAQKRTRPLLTLDAKLYQKIKSTKDVSLISKDIFVRFQVLQIRNYPGAGHLLKLCLLTLRSHSSKYYLVHFIVSYL